MVAWAGVWVAGSGVWVAGSGVWVAGERVIAADDAGVAGNALVADDAGVAGNALVADSVLGDVAFITGNGEKAGGVEAKVVEDFTGHVVVVVGCVVVAVGIAAELTMVFSVLLTPDSTNKYG